MIDYGGKGTHSQDVPTTLWSRIWTWLSGEQAAATVIDVCDEITLACALPAEPTLACAIPAEPTLTLEC